MREDNSTTEHHMTPLDKSVLRQLQAQKEKATYTGGRSRQVSSPLHLPIPGWNERRMTMRDFKRVCERERIVVIRIPWRIGMFTNIRGVPVIWLGSRSQFDGGELIQTAFHELGHYFLHRARTPLLRAEGAEGGGGVRDWFEVEANACAAIALSPQAKLGDVMWKYTERLVKKGQRAKTF